MIEAIIKQLRDGGHDVHCAVEIEGWKVSDLPADVGAREDLALIDNCDALVGLVGRDPSAGVQFELGYAVKARKRVVILPEADAKLGWFNQGVVNAGWVELASLDSLVKIFE